MLSRTISNVNVKLLSECPGLVSLISLTRNLTKYNIPPHIHNHGHSLPKDIEGAKQCLLLLPLQCDLRQKFIKCPALINFPQNIILGKKYVVFQLDL